MNAAVTHITLDSQDGIPTHEPGVLRFVIDSTLRHVSDIEWLTFEVQANHALTIDARSDKLFFSEDLRFFTAVLPHGSYTAESLQAAIQAAMACATDRVDGQGPRNRYEVRMLRDSNRVCIAADGTVAFALHNFQDLVKIGSLRRMGADEAQITFLSSTPEPMARGSLIEIFHPGSLPTMAQVLHAVGTTVLVKALQGPVLEQDVAGEGAGWTLRPLCHATALPELLGLGETDLRSSLPITIVSSSSPLLGKGITNLQKTLMHVGVDSPHGCVKGDRVLLDGFEGCVFLNGQEAAVQEVVSEQQLVLQVDASGLAQVPRDRPFRLTVDDKPFTFHPALTGALQAGENVFLTKIVVDRKDLASFQKLHDIAKGTWISAKLLPPFPSAEWSKGPLQVRTETSSKFPGAFVVKCQYHHPSASAGAFIKRSAVVGSKKMNGLHRKSVLLMRLRLGMSEAYGVMSLRQNNVAAFGRAQVKEGGYLTAADHSLVGYARFDPPLERVPFMDVSFLTPQGAVVPPNILGEYSVLLRCVASS